MRWIYQQQIALDNMGKSPLSCLLGIVPMILAVMSAAFAQVESVTQTDDGFVVTRMSAVQTLPCVEEALQNLLERRAVSGVEELDVEAFSLFDDSICGIGKTFDFRDCSPDTLLVYAGNEYLVTLEPVPCAAPELIQALAVWNTRTLEFEAGLLLAAAMDALQMLVDEPGKRLLLVMPARDAEGVTELVEFSGWKQGDIVLDYAESAAELQECLAERQADAAGLLPVQPIRLGDAEAIRGIPQLEGISAFSHSDELVRRLDIDTWQLKAFPVEPAALPDWVESWCEEMDVVSWSSPVWVPQKNRLFVPVRPHCWRVAEHRDGVTVWLDWRLYTGPGDSWAVVAGDFMYHGSSDCSRMLAMDKWGTVCGLESLRVLHQRPLEVMMRVECAAETLRNHRDATRILIRQLGFAAEALPESIQPGDLPNVEVTLPPLMAATDAVSFPVKLKATRNDIVRLTVRVNGESLPQPSPGLRSGQEGLDVIDIPLEKGENRVEVMAADASGLISRPVRFRIIRR